MTKSLGTRLPSIIIICLVLSCICQPLADAQDMYTSAQYWSFYLDSCSQLDKAMSTVRKQIDQNDNVVFSNGIKFNVDRMDECIKKVDAKYLKDTKYEQCQAKAKKANDLLVEANAYDVKMKEAREKVSRQQHENSPFYDFAKKNGFKDYSWLSALYSDYKQVGEAELKTWVIIVDGDCGQHYRAIKYAEPYVIYYAGRSQHHTCSGREPVAVLPAEGIKVNRGDYIENTTSYYVFMGTVEGKGGDGFPIKLPLLKQVKIKPKNL